MFILSVLSGLALFLFSINQLSQLMQGCISLTIKDKIAKYANYPFLSLITGTLLTAILQSSSGTTAILISLIRGHMITFRQGIGFIMGANLGTTVTSFITGINIQYLAPICLIVGILLYLTNRKSTLSLGIFYFGLLFFSIHLMESQLVQLLSFPKIQGIILLMAQCPSAAFFVGLLMTTLIQSSSAFIALLQQLCFLQMISLPIAMMLSVGSNVGTTITAYIACIGGSTESKMAAMYHFLFNVIGAICFILFYLPIVHWVESIFIPVKMQLAVFHALFNLISIIVIFPFNSILVKMIEKLFHYFSYNR